MWSVGLPEVKNSTKYWTISPKPTRESLLQEVINTDFMITGSDLTEQILAFLRSHHLHKVVTYEVWLYNNCKEVNWEYWIILLYNKCCKCFYIAGFTGQMDYLRGDSLNQQVRAAASVSYRHRHSLFTCCTLSYERYTHRLEKSMDTPAISQGYQERLHNKK